MDVRLGFNILAILGSGMLAGVLLAVGLSFGAYWQSLPAAAFLEWFAANDRFVPRAVPFALLVTLVGLAGSLLLGWAMPRERLLWGVALVCVALMLLVTAVWNGPLNQRFAGGEMAPSEVHAALRTWLIAHSARITLTVVATVLSIVAALRGSASA